MDRGGSAESCQRKKKALISISLRLRVCCACGGAEEGEGTSEGWFRQVLW